MTGVVEIPVYQSIKDTVRTTGISEFYLRKMVRQGTIPHIWTGNKVYINVPAFLKQLAMTESKGE